MYYSIDLRVQINVIEMKSVYKYSIHIENGYTHIYIRVCPQYYVASYPSRFILTILQSN